jgi:hypothetical protein
MYDEAFFFNVMSCDGLLSKVMRAMTPKIYEPDMRFALLPSNV